jgi:hypothetical protein
VSINRASYAGRHRVGNGAGAEEVIMRRTYLAVVMLVVAGVGAAACSSTKSGSGALVAASPNTSAGLPTAPPTATPTPVVGATQGQTAAPHKSGTSTNSGPPKVTLALKPIADYSGTNCPYHATATVTVSVDKGPIDLRGHWNPNYRLQLEAVELIPFHGTGPQSTTLTFGIDPPPDDLNVSVGFVVDEPTSSATSATTTFTMACGAKASDVTVNAGDSTKAQCPYSTSFHGTISSTVALANVTYEWRASGKSDPVKTGTLTFTKAGSVTVDSPSVTVMTKSILNDFVVSLVVTSPGGTRATAAAKCTGYKSP